MTKKLNPAPADTPVRTDDELRTLAEKALAEGRSLTFDEITRAEAERLQTLSFSLEVS